MKQESLPSGYTVAQLDDGRFYPLRARIGEYVDLSTMHWTTQYVPFALGPQPTRGTVSFAHRQLAEQYCHREHEEFTLLWNAAQHGWNQEIYSERNVWYREEILRLVYAHDPSPSWRRVAHIELDDYYTGIHAYIYFTLHGSFQSVRVKGSCVDDAVEALYQEVYEHIHGRVHVFEHFPERNAYYRDEIEAIAGEAPLTFMMAPPITDTPVAVASISFWSHYEVRRPTLDEALEALYEHVFRDASLLCIEARDVV